MLLEQRFRRRFLLLVDEHLAQLEWNAAKLSLESGISEPQISGIFTGKRPLSREHVNRICWAIAAGYEPIQEAGRPSDQRTTSNRVIERSMRPVGIGTLDGFLDEMLEAAGFGPLIGREKDFLWNRLCSQLGAKDDSGHVVQPSLRIGWVDYKYFSEARGKREPTGLAVDIAIKIAQLMGVSPKWVQCEWNNVIPRLLSAEIDVICPNLMQLPSRMFAVSFTASLPDVVVGTNGIVHRESINEVLIKGELKADRLALEYVEGEVGEAYCAMFAPGASLVGKAHPSFQEACQSLADEPFIDGQRRLFRCLVGDEYSCEHYAELFGSSLTMIYKEGAPLSYVHLPVAAAVHPEEPSLLNMLNTCLRILERTDYYDYLRKKTPYGKKLLKAAA